MRHEAGAGLPDEVADASVQDLDGVFLSEIESGALPDRIGTTPQPPYARYAHGEPVPPVFHWDSDRTPMQGRGPRGPIDLLRVLRGRRELRHVGPVSVLECDGLANENLSRLHRHGFDNVLDDFGSGFFRCATSRVCRSM